MSEEEYDYLEECDVEDVFGDSEAAEIGSDSAYGERYGADYDWQIFEVEL